MSLFFFVSLIGDQRNRSTSGGGKTETTITKKKRKLSFTEGFPIDTTYALLSLRPAQRGNDLLLFTMRYQVCFSGPFRSGGFTSRSPFPTLNGVMRGEGGVGGQVW